MAYTALEAAEERARLDNKKHRGESLTTKEEREYPYLRAPGCASCVMIEVKEDWYGDKV